MAAPDVLFSATVQSILAGNIVRAIYGVQLQLVSETLFLCQGDSFIDNTGQKWTGLGMLGQISGIQCGAEAATSPLQLTLSKVLAPQTADKSVGHIYSTLSRAVSDSVNETLGRQAVVYLMFFDSVSSVPIDLPYVVARYQLGSGSLAFDSTNGSVTFTLPAEPLFGSKHIPPLNLVSHTDQQMKYPGDNIFERVGYKHTVITY